MCPIFHLPTQTTLPPKPNPEEENSFRENALFVLSFEKSENPLFHLQEQGKIVPLIPLFTPSMKNTNETKTAKRPASGWGER